MLEREALARELGTRFRVHGGPFDGVELELTSLEDRAAATGYESFSLMFAGPSEPHLAQGTYELEHPRVGTHAIFIVPVGNLAPGVRYEAAFNRRRA